MYKGLASISNSSLKTTHEWSVFSTTKFFVHNYLSGKPERTSARLGLVAILVSDNGYQIVPPGTLWECCKLGSITVFLLRWNVRSTAGFIFAPFWPLAHIWSLDGEKASLLLTVRTAQQTVRGGLAHISFSYQKLTWNWFHKPLMRPRGEPESYLRRGDNSGSAQEGWTQTFWDFSHSSWDYNLKERWKWRGLARGVEADRSKEGQLSMVCFRCKG